MLEATIAFAIIVWVAGCSTAERAPDVIESTAVADTRAAVNINTASPKELMTIPHVGERTAARIIEHRERFGPFRKVEQLMLVEGISDDRFRRIRHLLRVD